MADPFPDDFSEVSSPEITDDELDDSPPVIVNKPKGPNEKPATAVSCWSMNLEAFILNQHIFNEKHFIAPLNRPDNSSFLPGAFSSPDVIPFVDIDGAHPWHRNSRIADVAKIPDGPKNFDNMLRVNRLGVYVHWTLPQHFRSGKTTDTGKNAGNVQHAHVPDRWVVFRCITETDASSSVSDPPALTAFMIESNRIRHFGGHFDPSLAEDFDVELEASPFIDRNVPVEKQVDVFMGMKRRFDENWDDPDPDGRYHTPLTLLDSANPLFADFQHHNSNIFSFHDDVSWTNKQGALIRPSTATISYAIFGYHSQHYEAKTVCHGSLYNVKWKRDEAPLKSEAMDIADRFNKHQPVSLGQDPLEALQAYLHSMPVHNDQETDWVGLIDEMKLAIGQAGHGGLLDSGIPQNLRAGFKPSDGGRCWRFNNDSVGPSKEPAADGHEGNAHIPSRREMRDLIDLDRKQAYIDALGRQETYLRHRLFCEWWKQRAQVEGGRGSDPICQAVGRKRLMNDLKALQRVKELRRKYPEGSLHSQSGTMHTTARAEFFSRADPSIVLGGLGNTWPAEFLTTDKWQPRSLEKLPFFGSKGAALVQEWLQKITTPAGSDPNQVCMKHGMKLFFQSPDLVKRIVKELQNDPGLKKLPQIFQELDSLTALNFNAPGWVRITIDTLMQEWAYALGNGDGSKIQPEDRPAYSSPAEIQWNDTQPCRALFVEWELEYYHLPKRFWTLEWRSDGTADYVISPGMNISSYDLMELRKRTITGRSLLQPNAEWVITTLLQQLMDKLLLDEEILKKLPNLKAAADKNGIKSGMFAKLQKVMKNLRLVSGTLDGLTDHLLTLHGGIHISPHTPQKPPAKGSLNETLLHTLLEVPEGQDVTPYGEDAYSIDRAERDFKPVTHGQARFTKFNIVDKFGQVISPIHNPKDSKTKPLYPCIGRSIACQPNISEGGGFANSVELDKEYTSQYFQLGHRINQDARLNTYFAINSYDYETYHESTYFSRHQAVHSWRPTTEYEDPVWGWLMLDFRSMGIQVYNAAGESMGQALVPDSIHGKAYWQVYYAEGDLSEVTNENSQLQQLIRRMSNTKFLIGLWSMLSDACQNIYHDPMSGDPQMLNMIGRPLALVNIGMNVELATPVMETQSYHDLLKKEEITLDQYKFEVLLGDKTNLRDGLIGYFPPAPVPPAKYDPIAVPEKKPSTDTTAEKKAGVAPPTDPSSSTSPTGQDSTEKPKPKAKPWKEVLSEKQPDVSTIYTEFGYPGRNNIDGENVKPDAFTSPSNHKIYVSPMHVNPADHEEAESYQHAIHNHASTVILGAIIDPFQPVHIATGILPSKSLKLPQWIIDHTLKKLRLLIRGGPVLMRGDLPGIDISPDTWLPPMNETKAEASVPALSNKGEWSWLQPNVSTYAEEEEDDEYLPKFVPYNLKSSPADYPLEMGPHTVLEGFYKYGLFEMKGELRPGKPTGDGK